MGRIKTFSQHTTKPTNEGGPESSDHLQRIPIDIKGDKEAAEMAKKEVGDGKEPNHFFITASNNYMFVGEGNEITSYADSPKSAPAKIEDRIEVETFGPYTDFNEAMSKANDIELNETTGPRYVMIEDRATGTIYEKFLKAEKKVVWNEEENDDTKQFGYHKK